MKGTYDEADDQVRRLMEVVGGSASAYESPPIPPQEEEQLPFPELPDPFRGPEEDQAPPRCEACGQSKTLSSQEILGSQEIGEDDGPVALPDSMCGLTLEIFAEGLHQTKPEALDDSYQCHTTVWECGELAAIWDAFLWVAANGKPREVTIDTGPAQLQQSSFRHWVLEDPGKGRKYMMESGNLAGHLEENSIFIWVMGCPHNDQDFGYIHDAWVFMKQGD